ncbi:hypothetical protein SY88_16835 [Clostridiales bacterium PH28_bin88]|nr:hypothetical protein SY88_16835 [Clostridiales bacterium PH28_bin88]
MGECTRWPSVVFRSPSQRQCLRCGETQQVEPAYCMDCGSPRCAYCPSCAMMGESRLCRPIYAIPGRPAQPDNPAAVQVHLDFALTPAQRDAAAAVRRFIHREGPGECLVWAACGAGKTEVALGAMAEVLQRGGCVLFAIPRRDVVQELEPRLKAAFPGVRVQALYGGSREKYRDAELVVATTHQAIRFFRQFPLVVMDEVDAFPYQGSEMLHYAVERARASDGKVLYLTATPHRELFSRAHRGQVELVYLPARPHGHPLPEPQVVVERSLQLKEGRLQIPETVLNLLHQSVEGDLAQVFVFVPAIHLAQRVGEALRDATAMPPFNHFTGDWVYSSHSRDPDRERKRERFCRGEFPILVTTTIMERGITVPRVNVLVLFAEQDRVFDEGTLVQVAGRAGRTQEYPGGRVWFVGSRVTAAMAGAVEKVRALNREAYQRGYLLPGYYLEKPAWVEG